MHSVAFSLLEIRMLRHCQPRSGVRNGFCRLNECYVNNRCCCNNESRGVDLEDRLVNSNRRRLQILDLRSVVDRSCYYLRQAGSGNRQCEQRDGGEKRMNFLHLGGVFVNELEIKDNAVQLP